MGSTRPETDTGNGVTSLADALRTDEPEDTRDCPHESCEGSLSLTDNDRVLCQTCRCTPEGVFLPLDPLDEGGSSASNPKGQRGEDRVPQAWNHDEYPNGAARLAGGYDDVYDEDDDERPCGVGDEYTFDLSTL